MHGKVVCKKCGDIIRQCRCIEKHKLVVYEVCKECASDETKDK